MALSPLAGYRAQIKAQLYPRGDTMFEVFRLVMDRISARSRETKTHDSGKFVDIMHEMAANRIFELDLISQRDVGGLVWSDNSCFVDALFQSIFFKPNIWIYRNLLYKHIDHKMAIEGCIDLTLLRTIQTHLRNTKEGLQTGNLFGEYCIDIRIILARCITGAKLYGKNTLKGINDMRDVILWMLEVFKIQNPPPFVYFTGEPNLYNDAIGLDFMIVSLVDYTPQDVRRVKPKEKIDAIDVIDTHLELGAIILFKVDHYTCFIKRKDGLWHFYNDLDRSNIAETKEKVLSPKGYKFGDLFKGPTDFLTEYQYKTTHDVLQQASFWIYFAPT